MKKSLLLGITWVTLIALTATTLYAQTTTGSSVIARMKAAATAFTLSADLNPGQTGFESAPVSWKKTGNMLTAAEWNRMLELVAQGGTGGGSGISVELWKCTCGGYINMVTTQNLTFGETCVFGNGGTASNVQYSSWSCTKIQNAWGTGTSTPTLSNLTYINPDNTDFAPLDCVAGMNYMINPIAFSATSAPNYTNKKLAVLKSGNWTVKGTNFSRNRNITSGSSHTLRVSTIIDGTTTHLLNNTVDKWLYANSFSSPVIVPTGKTVELRASLRNNVLYGGNIVAWCTN